MTISQELFIKARRLIPGGVNSPVRSFNGVGGEPIFFKKGQGPYLYDADDKRYIDYVGSWGPLILGHCHPKVVEAIVKATSNGVSFGAPTQLEVELAERITSLVPNFEMVRMVNSGTEATMTAIRMARGITGRDKIIKFVGCYHGHSDSLLVKAGSGILTLGIPSSPGVPESVVQHTLTAPYNDLAYVAELFNQYSNQIAAIIIEPVAGNMGCILPQPNFLAGLRELCTKHQSLLIFDEVMTGFRIALGGAQEYFKVTPDLTTLGKVIGGGMPVGAIAGKRAVMECLAPVGPVYQAGTLSGNPCAMAAGLATLNELAVPGFFENVTQKTTMLLNGINKLAYKYDINLLTSQAGSMFGICFTHEKLVTNYEMVAASNIKFFNEFFHQMLNAGVYLAPSAFEAGFMSAAHQEEDIAYTLGAIEAIFQRVNQAIPVAP